jgi:hypothetical protein
MQMAYTKLIPRHTRDAQVEEISSASSHYLLSIPPGKADRYRLAQLDDYTKLKRGNFPLHPPITFRLSARASSNSIPGTWGFGLWNDPFGLSLGFGGNPFRLPVLPNAAWFFGASLESFLSFQEHQVPPSTRREPPAYGFLAQAFRAPGFHPLLLLAGLTLPFSRRMARRLLGRIIDEAGFRLSLDVTQWHSYMLDWRASRVSFQVDDTPVFESQVSPRSPLGAVIWIDNQYAAFTPEGKIGFGVLENPESAWLEIKDVDVEY